MNVFITDGDERPALAATRALGRRGVGVIVGESRRSSLAGMSRYCHRRVQYPSPYEQPDTFAEFLCEFVRRQSIDVVLPITDVTTHAVSACRGMLDRHTRCCVPSLETFAAISDKAALVDLARGCGIRIPRTVVVRNETHLLELLPEIRYPAVVKPSRSRIRSGDGWIRTTVTYADNERNLVDLFRNSPVLQRHPSLIQERVVGRGTGLFVLCDRGKILTSFAHRRLREKPPSGGVSVLCESVAVDPERLAEAERLLTPLGWHGVAMLEYKTNSDTGEAFLMEVNGRFWGSLQLAIDAGIDFPFLVWQLAQSRPAQVPRSYAVGVRSRWLLGDVDHLLTRLLHERSGLSFDAPPLRQVPVAFVRAWSGSRNDVMRASDIRPGFFELEKYIGEAAASLTTRLKRTFLLRRSAAASAPQHATSHD